MQIEKLGNYQLRFHDQVIWVYYLNLSLSTVKQFLLVVTTDFTKNGGSHFYGLPCPSEDSLDPMDHFCTLMFPISSLKTPVIFYTRLLNPFSHIHADITLKHVYIGMCAKDQKYLVFCTHPDVRGFKGYIHMYT